ncbi:MAG: carboxypeptidase regulatory-like domain-containing protein [Bacteroides sp.]|nr:carboxypeptidase regulatory-like domain-containing protein [Bacteroides sp.]MCM1085531.1 carboxypeptidase regulatory-like domain-containing protein [Bacteroides sp.]
MRKLSSLFKTIVLGGMFCLVSSAFAQTPTFALSEDFEKWPPVGWELNPTSGSYGGWMQDYGWSFGPYYAYEGSFCAMFDNFNCAADVRGSITSPELDLQAFENPRLTFMWINQATSPFDGQWAQMIVYVSENGMDFRGVDTLVAARCQKWELYERPLSKNTKKIRIQGISNYGGNNTFVDFLHVGDRPLLQASNLQVTWDKIQARQAEAVWEGYDNVSNFELVYGKKGFDITTASVQAVSGTSFMMTGLEPLTEYEFRVRQVYSADRKSEWSAPKAFTTLPTCPRVTDVTVTVNSSSSATLSWTEKGDAREWDICYGPIDFHPSSGQGTVLRGITENPCVLTGLPAGTYLDVYVRGVCGDGDTAQWSEYPVSFQTACADNPIPYFEAFETGAFTRLPTPCWTVKAGLLKDVGAIELVDTIVTSSTWTGHWFGNDKRRNFAARANFESAGMWMVTPSIDLGNGAQKYVLQFDMAVTLNNSMRWGAPNADDDRFAVLVSTDNGNTWTQSNLLRLWDNTTSENVLKDVPPYGQPVTLDLSDYSGTVKIAFYAESTKGDYWERQDINNVFIDNLAVRPLPEKYMVAQGMEGQQYLIINQENTIYAVVSNQGSEPQKDFVVELVDGNGTVVATATYTQTLYAEESVRVPLVWTPSRKGVESLSARIVFENDVEKEKTVSMPFKAEVLSEETKVNAIGDGRMLRDDVPINFFSINAQAQIIYYEDELSSVGAITALKFSHLTSNIHYGFPLHIRLGTTEKNSFNSDSEWVNEDSLTLVYAATVDSLGGEGDLIVTLDVPYTYTGGNLLVSIRKGNETPDPSYLKTGESWWATKDPLSRQRSHSWIGNEGGDGFGSLSEYSPNVVFYIDSMSSGRIRGKVSGTDGKAIASVRVECLGTAITATTDQAGQYEMNRILEGTYDMKASKHGYFDTTVSHIVVSEKEIVTVNFALRELPVYEVRGKVLSNDGAPMRGVSVFLEGYQNYEAATLSDGTFAFQNVYAPKTYRLSIQEHGFAPYDTVLTVVDGEIFLNVTLHETVYPAVGFRGVVSENGNRMDLKWENPDWMTCTEVSLDDGTSENGMSLTPYQDIRIGNLYKNHAPLFLSSVKVSGSASEKAGPDSVTVEIYDKNRKLLLESSKFFIPAGGWTEAKLPYMLELEEDYYVMVHFGGEREHYTNYLDIDETGAHVAEKLAYYVGKDGQWLNMDEDMMAGEMVFMLRPVVFKDRNAGKSVRNFKVWKVEEGSQAEPESWQLLTPEPITATTLNEEKWATYPDGSTHLYAIQTFYSGNVQSDYAFCRPITKGENSSVESPKSLRFRIYPNPARDFIYVESESELKEIRIHDVYGRRLRVVSCSGQNPCISLHGLPQGLLLMEAVGSDNQVGIQKIITL